MRHIALIKIVLVAVVLLALYALFAPKALAQWGDPGFTRPATPQAAR
jgi:hypothetical protein